MEIVTSAMGTLTHVHGGRWVGECFEHILVKYAIMLLQTTHNNKR